MHQFEMVNGQARILDQTASHVAGAAFYYQRRNVTEQPWPAVKKQCFYERKKRSPTSFTGNLKYLYLFYISCRTYLDGSVLIKCLVLTSLLSRSLKAGPRRCDPKSGEETGALRKIQ